ncbi:ABC transporter substrate-binding protein [Thermosynechococcaceae cyanobacterium BACA0444]|uniref:ABC transporter substrate-binding protein n=1 Tax=Pseudocalidococcus azoricus BACA0444 TaxID=2918990 RepID=A0AAE4FQH9_9CYAN|nr:ABC transporter substrate-binding protein [Pseudocalidococcus azoricus]MDS3859442.1 ABC transporter substrate-binding protein [Pseudocalidococcus azoricus BACA0444]
MRLWAVILSFCVGLGLTGCNLDGLRNPTAQVPQLIASITVDPKTFNYALNEESPNVFGFIYEGLISENGLTGELEPALAESWEITPDNLSIIYTLRPNLKWSDGHPLTTADVVFTYNEIYLNPKIPSSTIDILRVGQQKQLPTIQALDARRVQFSLPEPFAPFFRTSGLPILPEHSLAEGIRTLDRDGNPKFLTMWGTQTNPTLIIANGPFTIESYTTNQRIIFRRNPHYWKRPEPYLERFVWQIVDSTDTALIQFRSRGLDVLDVAPMNFSLLKREEESGNFRIYNGGPASGVTFLSFNQNKGSRNGQPLVDPIKSAWFNSIPFRQAVAYAIDRQTMINNLYRGLGATQNSPLSVQSPYYLSPEAGLKVYDFDPDQSRKLLAEAGFSWNQENQLLDPKGHRVQFTLLSTTGSPVREAISAQIKQNLAAIGIQADLTFISFSTLVEKLANSYDWEAYIGAFTGGVEPNNGFNIWSPNGRLHVFNQADAALRGREVQAWEQRIGDLYIQGAQELNEDRRKEIYFETQQITQANVPFIYLVNPLTLAAFRNRIQGAEPTGLGGTLWNIAELKAVN